MSAFLEQQSYRIQTKIMDNRRQETSKKVEFPQLIYSNSIGFGPPSNQRVSQEFDNPFIMRQPTNEKYEDLYHIDLIRRSNELQNNVFNNFTAFGFQPGTSQPFPSFMPNMAAFSQMQNQLETPQLNMAAQINQHYQAHVQATPLAQPQLGSVQISNMIKDGMWMVCEIDTLFLKRFYSIPKKIFAPANQKSPQQLESNLTVSEWLKQRFRCHFQPELSNFLSGIVDRIEKSKYHKVEETPSQYQYGPIQADFDFLDKLCSQCKDADNSENTVRDMAQLLFNIIEKFLNR